MSKTTVFLLANLVLSLCLLVGNLMTYAKVDALTSLLGHNLLDTKAEQRKLLDEREISREFITADTQQKVTHVPPSLLTQNNTTTDKHPELTAHHGKSTWDCDIYYCEEGDLPIYPFASNIAQAIAKLPYRVLNEKSKDGQVALYVIFDPTCPKCKGYFSTTLTSLLDSKITGEIRIIPTLYADKITTGGLKAVMQLLCGPSVKASIDGLVRKTPIDTSSCRFGLKEAKQIVLETRRELAPFQLDGVAPVTLSAKSIWIGNLTYSDVLPHLNQ